MDVGELVRRARIDRGLDQTDLARRAGTTQTYVSRVERGAVTPSFSTLQRMLNAMGLRLRVDVEPLPHGNASIGELRAGLEGTSPEERVEQAMTLSRFLTEVAAARPGGRPR